MWPRWTDAVRGWCWLKAATAASLRFPAFGCTVVTSCGRTGWARPVATRGYAARVYLPRKLQLLDEQVAAANGGHPAEFQAWRDQTNVVLRTVMGADSHLYKQFEDVSYSPSVWVTGMDTSGYRPAGVRSVISILTAAKKELELVAEVEQVVDTDETDEQRAVAAEHGRVFIVHGHDDAKKHELARLVRALTGTEPIILHEQPNSGRVLIEKLEETSSAAGYVVALLTADDMGRAKSGADQRRARQNVVFETGFFCGAFGRSSVAVLVEDGVERPSDLQGLVYIDLDAAGAWKQKVASELESAGMPVEWSALRGA